MGWNLLATFLEGIATFVSPCLLPLLPVYVAYVAGETAEAGGRGRTLVGALAFVAGFTVPFVLLGAFSGAVGTFLVRAGRVLDILCGVVVAFMGLAYLGVLPSGLLARGGARMSGACRGRTRAPFALGLVFAVGWSPCVGTFLASALSLAAASGSVLVGVALLLAYSLGLGVPFVLSALLIDELQGAFGWVKAHYAQVERVCGGALVVLGALMAAGALS